MSNKEKRNLYNRLWRAKNLERSRQLSRENYLRHKEEEKYIAYRKGLSQTEEQKEKSKIRARKAYAKNKEYFKQKAQQWRLDNPQKYRANNVRSKLKRRGYGAPTIETINLVFEQYPACVYCLSTSNLTIDHIVPLSLGGSNEFDNLCVACNSCNSSKNNKPLLYWLCTK